MRCESELIYPDRLPDPKVRWQQPLSEANGLIVVSGDRKLSQKARSTLAMAGLVGHTYASKKIARDNVEYHILLLDLSPLENSQVEVPPPPDMDVPVTVSGSLA